MSSSTGRDRQRAHNSGQKGGNRPWLIAWDRRQAEENRAWQQGRSNNAKQKRK